MTIDVMTIERIAYKNSSNPKTNKFSETTTASVNSRPIEVFKWKYFLKISGGIVVPPLDELFLYKIATPSAKMALPKMTESKRSGVIIVSGMMAMISGKTRLPKRTLKKGCLPKKRRANTSIMIFSTKMTIARSNPNADSKRIPSPLTPPAAI